MVVLEVLVYGQLRTDEGRARRRAFAHAVLRVQPQPEVLQLAAKAYKII